MFLSNRLRNVFLTISLGAALVVVNATQVMHRPDTFKNAPHQFAKGESVPRIIHKRSGAKANMAYFTNWYVYATLLVSAHAHIHYRTGVYTAQTSVRSKSPF